MTASDKYTAGSDRTTAAAPAANTIQMQRIHIFRFHTVLAIESGENAGFGDEEEVPLHLYLCCYPCCVVCSVAMHGPNEHVSVSQLFTRDLVPLTSAGEAG